MATSSQDTNIADIAAPASATPTNIGHVLGLNAAKTQDVLVPLSMLRQVIAQELQSALSAITSGSPNVPVLDGGNLKYMTLANFAKVAGGLTPNGVVSSGFNADNVIENGVHIFYSNGSGTPSKYGILITIRAISTGTYGYCGLQLFFNVSTKKIHFRFGDNGQNTYGSWSDGV